MKPPTHSLDALDPQVSGDPIKLLPTSAHPAKHRHHQHRDTNARTSDRWIYRLVVAALGITVIVSVIGSIALGIGGHPIPDGVVALGSSSVGALAGLLAPAPHM